MDSDVNDCHSLSRKTFVRYFCQVRERLKKMGHLQPLNIFLRQEIDRMRKVLTMVKATLTDLKLAIDGTIIMNEVGAYC